MDLPWNKRRPDRGDLARCLERAQVAEKRGQWDRAVELYREAIVLDPGESAPHLSLAEIALRRHRPADAVAALRGALSASHDPRQRLEIVLRISKIEIERGNPDEARRVLEDFLSFEPDGKFKDLVRSRLAALADPQSPGDPAGGAAPTPVAGTDRIVAIPASSVESDPMGQPFGRYRLIAELGRGGMGVVWRAWDAESRREVAVKILSASDDRPTERRKRFLREARAAARLRHPNIVPVHEVGEHEGKHYLTSDLVAGWPLSEMTKAPFSVEKAVELVSSIAGALQYAHDHGVVHRDVKPSNILVDREGRAHIVDFGLAKDAEKTEDTELTQSGWVMGTPRYMSPEQAEGRMKEMGPASDQFSLGVVLYELLTGRSPFGGESLRDILNAIAERNPIPPSELNPAVPPELDGISLRALQKKPERRYPSMADFARDLDLFLRGRRA